MEDIVPVHPRLEFLIRVSSDPKARLSFVITGMLAVMTFLLYRRVKTANQRHRDWTAELKSSSKSAGAPLREILQERKQNGTVSAPKQSANGAGDTKKPFGSSYYYAHNNPQAKGGYKDGLRMEDYTMNQPRLLSRGGSSLIEEESHEENITKEESNDAPEGTSSNTNYKIKTNTSRDVTLITKYQWDDPGNSDGIAHIRIDSLPSKDGKSTVAWSQVQPVHDMTGKLLGKGLLVQIETEPKQIYQLQIRELYGEVADVHLVNKTKRLLVRLYKKRKLIGSNRNLGAWPRP